ncbi:uncharacterized protein [Pleurodeles waltl]|uniref:uncharacterized protein n=1 Tax=Pleurodeles waltl TaxID=8319 RepID=UPI00370996DC
MKQVQGFPGRYMQKEENSSDHKVSSAKDFLKKSIQIEKEKSKPSIHKLLLDRRKIDKDGHRQMCTFGPRKHASNGKVIMLLGATGSGKTTLFNGMTNYILGVKWEDDFRFKLIDEETNSTQAERQTSSITSYHLIHQEGFQVPHSLTIIDTPGFGDTRGIDQDRFIVEQIREFFSTPGGVDHLDAVCFVVQSSLARLTPSQRYIFDSILSIFGKDVADNIFVLVTFADGQKPPVKSGGDTLNLPRVKGQLREGTRRSEEKVAELIDEFSKCLQRLEEINLKPKPISTPEYIDLLIMSEKEEAKPGYLDCIQSLTAMKQRVVLITNVCKREELMSSSHAPSGSQKSTMGSIFQSLKNWIKYK